MRKVFRKVSVKVNPSAVASLVLTGCFFAWVWNLLDKESKTRAEFLKKRTDILAGTDFAKEIQQATLFNRKFNASQRADAYIVLTGLKSAIESANNDTELKAAVEEFDNVYTWFMDDDPDVVTSTLDLYVRKNNERIKAKALAKEREFELQKIATGANFINNTLKAFKPVEVNIGKETL